MLTVTANPTKGELRARADAFGDKLLADRRFPYTQAVLQANDAFIHHLDGMAGGTYTDLKGEADKAAGDGLKKSALYTLGSLGLTAAMIVLRLDPMLMWGLGIGSMSVGMQRAWSAFQGAHEQRAFSSQLTEWRDAAPTALKYLPVPPNPDKAALLRQARDFGQTIAADRNFPYRTLVDGLNRDFIARVEGSSATSLNDIRREAEAAVPREFRRATICGTAATALLATSVIASGRLLFWSSPTLAVGLMGAGLLAGGLAWLFAERSRAQSEFAQQLTGWQQALS